MGLGSGLGRGIPESMKKSTPGSSKSRNTRACAPDVWGERKERRP
jgi:hypothetical protein